MQLSPLNRFLATHLTPLYNSIGESDSEERGGEDGVCEEVGALQEDTGAVPDQDLGNTDKSIYENNALMV